MLLVPTLPTPSQSLQVQLADQACIIEIYQTAYGMFVNLFIGSTPILYGAIAQDANRMVRDGYLGFVGDLMFVDTQGGEDPVYTGLGSRWQLLYLEAADLANVG